MSNISPSNADLLLERQEKNSNHYLDMEEKVRRVRDMAHVTTMLWKLYRSELTDLVESADRGPPVSGTEAVEHMEPWNRAVEFMVRLLYEAADALGEHYTVD